MVRLLLCLFLAAVACPGSAAESGPADSTETRAPSKPEASVDVRMEEVEIKGEIERPGVFYIIPRRQVEMDLGRQTRDYTPELSRPLDPAALERWVRLQQSAR